MELKTYFAQDRNGNLIPSANVSIYLTGTTTLASGLTNVSGSPMPNPFTADADGKIQFRAPDGIYDMQVSLGSTTGVKVTFQCVDVEQQLTDANTAADRAETAADNAEAAAGSIEGQTESIKANTREHWRRTLAESGLNLADGSFEDGATVNTAIDAVWHIEGGQCYTWGGTLPKTVSADSTPASTGGISAGAWNSTKDKLNRNYKSIPEMVSDASLVAGQRASTGGSRWEIVSVVTPLPLSNGLYAQLINELYVEDFGGDGTSKITALNNYITAGMASSYATQTELEAYKYSLKPVTVLFTSLVVSSVPLLLMRHVHYDQVGAQTYFNRQMPVGFYYAPSDLNTSATEPVVFELHGTSYVRKTGSLIGTINNDITDVNGYITMSDGFLFDLSVACTGGVKVGLNFSMSPGCKGTKTSIGITARGGNVVSAPLLGMYFRWSWGADFRSPKVLAMRQGIHLYKANAGLRITNPYVARVGANADNPELVYPAAAWTTEGKNQNTGITCDTVRDFVIDEPVVEWWRQAFALNNTDAAIRKPHIEDVGGNMIMRHCFVIANSYLDLDNWSQINYTCLSYGFYFCGQDGNDRKVIARGMSPVGGFTNGMVGGTYTNSPLRVENVSAATTDYGFMGDWNAINYLNIDVYREIYVNPTTGSDENTGLVSSRALATLERAIEVANKLVRKGGATGEVVINVISSVTLSRVVRAYKGFRINASSATITTSASGYIEAFGDLNIQINSGAIAGSSEPLIRHVYGRLNVEIAGTAVISNPAIVRTVSSHPIAISQTGGNTIGIAKYVDGAGIAPVSVVVKSASRNTNIDSVPVSTNQLLLGSKISS